MQPSTQAHAPLSIIVLSPFSWTRGSARFRAVKVGENDAGDTNTSKLPFTGHTRRYRDGPCSDAHAHGLEVATQGTEPCAGSTIPACRVRGMRSDGASHHASYFHQRYNRLSPPLLHLYLRVRRMCFFAHGVCAYILSSRCLHPGTQRRRLWRCGWQGTGTAARRRMLVSARPRVNRPSARCSGRRADCAKAAALLRDCRACLPASCFLTWIGHLPLTQADDDTLPAARSCCLRTLSRSCA
jgi:hypothetical protein